MSTRLHMLKFATLVGLPAIILWMLSSLFRTDREAAGRIKTDLPDTAAMQKTVKRQSTDRTALLRDSIVNFGKSLLGTRYVPGACSRDGFDCSGFVYYVFQHVNVKVPRSSSGYGDFGREIPLDSVRKGDVLVFLSPTRNAIGHVGIVSNPKGKESDFIHASSGREMKVMVTSLKQEQYARRFVKAVDVLPAL